MRSSWWCAVDAAKQLRIVKGRPPNYASIVEVIGRPPANAMFAWGDVLYVPNPPPGFQLQIDPWTMEHERTHSRQQAIIGVVEWWRRWLEDPEFRLGQELAAYRNQYQLAAQHLAREGRRALARQIANDLSGTFYGRMIKRQDALEAIVGGD